MSKVQDVLLDLEQVLQTANRIGAAAIPVVGTVMSLAEKIIGLFTPDELQAFSEELARLNALIAESRRLDEEYRVAGGNLPEVSE